MRKIFLLLSLNIALVSTGEAMAASNYSFVRIADTTQGFNAVQSPVINAQGLVAFRGGLSSGVSGIFTGDGTNINAIVTSSDGFSLFALPSLNNLGIVNFSASLNSSGSGLFTDETDPTQALVDSNGFLSYLGISNINDGKTIAFVAGLDNAEAGVFTRGEQGDITNIADTSGQFSAFIGGPSLNNQGTVSFLAQLDVGNSGIFSQQGGQLNTVIVTDEPFTIAGTTDTLSSLGSPSLNNNNTNIFRAGLISGEGGIFISNNGVITPIADSSNEFSTFGEPSINDFGQVSFLAGLDQGGFALFSGQIGETFNRIIGTGDTLFGKEISSLSFFGKGLNNMGQLAFYASFEDGSQGIFIGAEDIAPEIPETSATLPFLVVQVLVGLLWQRKFTKP